MNQPQEPDYLPEEQPVPAKRPMRRGDPCPRCGSRMDYNGMLNLECPQCGFIESTGGGCT